MKKVIDMATVPERDLPDAVHRELHLREATHARSTEAEVRDNSETTVCPPQRLSLRTALAQVREKAAAGAVRLG
jgi:plasmid stability protein